MYELMTAMWAMMFARPDEVVHRLAYADLLEEQGKYVFLQRELRGKVFWVEHQTDLDKPDIFDEEKAVSRALYAYDKDGELQCLGHDPAITELHQEYVDANWHRWGQEAFGAAPTDLLYDPKNPRTHIWAQDAQGHNSRPYTYPGWLNNDSIDQAIALHFLLGG